MAVVVIGMELKEILEKLCWYDKRNPNCMMDDEDIEEKEKEKERGQACYCDNCFHGNNRLAREILRLRAVISEDLAEALRELLVETNQHATGDCQKLKEACNKARAALAKAERNG